MDIRLRHLKETRKTLHDLQHDIALARKWENWKVHDRMIRERISVSRFLSRLMGSYLIRENPPFEPKSLGEVVIHMREMVRAFRNDVDSHLEAMKAATGVLRNREKQVMKGKQERLALALRNLKAKAKRLGPWSEALDEEFAAFTRIR